MLSVDRVYGRPTPLRMKSAACCIYHPLWCCKLSEDSHLSIMTAPASFLTSHKHETAACHLCFRHGRGFTAAHMGRCLEDSRSSAGADCMVMQEEETGTRTVMGYATPGSGPCEMAPELVVSR